MADTKRFIVVPGKSILVGDTPYQGGAIVDLDPTSPEAEAFIASGTIQELDPSQEAAVAAATVEAAPIKSPLSDEMAPQRDYSAEREARVVPVAKDLLKRIANHPDLVIGSGKKVTEESMALFYKDLYVSDIIPVIFGANLLLNDIPYLFSIMMQAIQLTSDVTTNSIQQSREIANAKKWGVEDTDDLSLQDLQEALTGSRELIKPEEPVADDVSVKDVDKQEPDQA